MKSRYMTKPEIAQQEPVARLLTHVHRLSDEFTVELEKP